MLVTDNDSNGVREEGLSRLSRKSPLYLERAVFYCHQLHTSTSRDNKKALVERIAVDGNGGGKRIRTRGVCWLVGGCYAL